MTRNRIIARNKFIALFFALFFSVVLAVFPFGKRDTEGPANGDKVTVTGTVRLLGTGLFNELAVTDEKENNWFIDEADRGLLEGKEHMTVTITGTVKKIELRRADLPAPEIKLVLKNIEIISGAKP